MINQQSKLIKKCPHCKTEIDATAKKCPQCQTDLRSWFLRHKVFSAILFFFFVGLIISLAGGNENSGNTNTVVIPITFQNTNTQEKKSVGDNAILDAGENVDPIFLAVDKDSFDQLSKALLANDTLGVIELADKGKIFGASRGVKVIVTDRETFIREVRILEGVKEVDNDKVGLKGWVPMEWVK